MTDKIQKATQVKFKSEESLTKESKFVEYILPRRGIRVLLELARRWTQHFSKIHQEKHNIERIWMWNPMTTGYIMLTLIYVISMEFLSLSRRRSIPPRETSPSAKSEEKRLFRSLPGQRNFILCSAPNLQEEFSSCEFYPITNGFIDAPAIKPDHFTWNVTRVVWIKIQSSCVFFRQTLSITETRTKVLVGVFSPSIWVLYQGRTFLAAMAWKNIIDLFWHSSRRHTRQGHK